MGEIQLNHTSIPSVLKSPFIFSVSIKNTIGHLFVDQYFLFLKKGDEIHADLTHNTFGAVTTMLNYNSDIINLVLESIHILWWKLLTHNTYMILFFSK